MPWFKVDDGFYDHPKTLGLDMAARGLWVSAGSYCARHLTDGVISDRQIRAIGGTRKQAEKLVAAGLWSSDGASPSARRYSFVNWRDFQPTREEVEEKRAIDRDRKAQARAKKAAKQGNRENVRVDVRADFGGNSGRTALGIHKMSALPDPTRPDPTLIREVGSYRYGPNASGSESPSPENSSAVSLASLRSADSEIDFSEDFGTPDLWSTAADPRCFEHAGLDRSRVPACRRCQEAREFFEAREAGAKAARRARILDCPLCDDNGLRVTASPDGGTAAVRCNHDPAEPPF